ncbi:hypothetical protein GGS20DRAFT_367950 [Poronia punctata]|nr:hypothetical protein GGS20DRAFT_367950 [Poronia punctata]
MADLATSLVGTTLKLVLFSIDFVSEVKQVHKHGGTDQSRDLALVAESVGQSTARLENELALFEDQASDPDGVLDPDEQRQLMGLSRRAAEIGRELQQKLDKVIIQDKSLWNSLKAAARRMWDRDDLEATEKRLKGIKDEILFSIIVSTRSKTSHRPDDQRYRVLATLEEIAGHQAESREDVKGLIDRITSVEKASETRYNELIEQHQRAISRSTSPLPPHTASCADDQSSLEAAEWAVLNSLWYPSIYDREESISEAHAKTYQWLYEDPKSTGKTWSSLADFLQGSEPIYWITGKPGSGKSTLMKFVYGNPRTQSLLEQWAGDKDLIRASFYFFYNGSSEQKSELGLLRSLLHSILDQRRDFIPAVFADRFQAARGGRSLPSEVSLAETKRALDVIWRKTDKRFFISIDGLDEFDPDVSRTHVQSLIDFTYKLERCGNVKVLVASRPLAEFEFGYRGRPSLRVQDLTEDDIRNYCNEKLMGHSRMKSLVIKDPENVTALLQSIITASLGVFLWVRLVVESLYQGLTNCDSIADLRIRLEELPSDLEELYSTLLSRVDAMYNSQTAQIIAVCMEAPDVLALELWFVMEAESDHDLVFRTRVAPVEDGDVRERVLEMGERITSRCKGLVEVVPTETRRETIRDGRYLALLYDISTPERKATARFIHRSVSDFVRRPPNWSTFIQKYLPPDFDLHLARFRGGILMIKTCCLRDPATWCTLVKCVSDVMYRANRCQPDKEGLPVSGFLSLLADFDRAAQAITNLYCDGAAYIPIEPHPAFVGPDLPPPDRSCHWAAWVQYRESWGRWHLFWPFYEEQHASLMSIAVEHGMSVYIRNEIKVRGQEVLRKEGLPLLGHSLILGRLSHHREPAAAVYLLLANGSDPNELFKGVSIWQWFLWVNELVNDIGGFGTGSGIEPSLVEVMEKLILAGANPNAYLAWSPGGPEYPQPRRYRPGRWGLRWFPQMYSNSSFCTVLLALTRYVVRVKEDQPHVLEQVRRLIKLLKERGAVEEEITDKHSIKTFLTEINEKIDPGRVDGSGRSYRREEARPPGTVLQASAKKRVSQLQQQ